MLKIILTLLVLGAAATGALWWPAPPPADTDRDTTERPAPRTPPTDKEREAGRDRKFSRHPETVEQIELGMARGEVLAIAGAPDREDVMSTDFGRDVALCTGSGRSGFRTDACSRSRTTADRPRPAPARDRA